ncbi:MAG: transporter [Frankiales bacterium]|nr:transporter [Frankiales bacterium]
MGVLCLAGLSFALAQTAIAPALDGMARTLHHSRGDVTWVLTSYFISSAVLTPVFGRLGDLHGKRRMLVVSLLLFSVGSAMSALAPNLALVLAGRVVQGAGGGIFPLAFGLVRDVLPREHVPGGLGTISALTGVGAGFGLLLGGTISDSLGYEFVFWLGAVPALLAAVLIRRVVPDNGARADGTVDVLGALALALALALPLLALSRGSQWGWASPRVLTLAVIGVASVVAFTRRSRRAASPLVNLTLLAQPVLLRTNLATFLVGVVLYVPFLLLPAIAQAPRSTGYGLGWDATGAGVLLVPGCFIGLAAGTLTGVLVRRFGSKVPMALGAGIAAVGLALLAVRHGTVPELLVLGTLTSLGTSLSFSSMPNLIIEAVSADQTGESTGVNSVVRTVGAAVGSQVTAVLLATFLLPGTLEPSETALTSAFLVGAGAALAALLVALWIPARGGDEQDMLSYIGSASALPEPALSGEHR